MYLHLWNAHKQEKSDLIHIVKKGWRPPAWAAEAVKQKKMALREREARPRWHNKKGACYPRTDHWQ